MSRVPMKRSLHTHGLDIVMKRKEKRREREGRVRTDFSGESEHDALGLD